MSNWIDLSSPPCNLIKAKNSVKGLKTLTVSRIHYQTGFEESLKKEAPSPTTYFEKV